tara:strand:+ start:4698 stop:5075 length:378 start_codon:yes stop_codon:yes gene_type:complete
MELRENKDRNVLGEEMISCCNDPKTGFFRDGYCNTNYYDTGKHIICVIVTNKFLQFSNDRGNDLITASPESNFPGLKEGDKWCLCITRWVEALENGCAPKVVLESSHFQCLDYISLEELKKYSAI